MSRNLKRKKLEIEQIDAFQQESDEIQEEEESVLKIRKISEDSQVELLVPQFDYATQSSAYCYIGANYQHDLSFNFFKLRAAPKIKIQDNYIIYNQMDESGAIVFLEEFYRDLKNKKLSKNKRVPKLDYISTKLKFKIDCRQRLEIIKLIQKGRDNKDIAAVLFLQRSEVSRIRYEYFSSQKTMTQNQGKRTKITPPMKTDLEFYIQTHQGYFMSYNSLSLLMKEKYPQTKFSNHTIQKMLDFLRMTYKKSTVNPQQRNIPRIIASRNQKTKLIAKLLQEHKKFIYIDECAIDETLVPFGGYAKAGIPFVIEQAPRKERVSLLAAITDEKLIGYQLFKGSVKAGDYGSFLLEILNKNQHIRDNMKNYVFYMDNAQLSEAEESALDDSWRMLLQEGPADPNFFILSNQNLSQVNCLFNSSRSRAFNIYRLLIMVCQHLTTQYLQFHKPKKLPSPNQAQQQQEQQQIEQKEAKTNYENVSTNGLEDQSPNGQGLIGYLLTQLIGLVCSETLDENKKYEQNLQDIKDQRVYVQYEYPELIKDQINFFSKIIDNLANLDIRVVKLLLLFNRKNLKSEENLENSNFLSDEYLNNDEKTLRNESNVRQLLQKELQQLLPTSLIALSSKYCLNNNSSGETFINGTIGLKSTLFKDLQKLNIHDSLIINDKQSINKKKVSSVSQEMQDDYNLKTQLEQMECFEVLFHEFIHKKRQATTSGGYSFNRTPVKFKSIDDDNSGESGLWFVQKLLGIKHQYIKYTQLLEIKNDQIKVSETITVQAKDIINEITSRFLDINSWMTTGDKSKPKPLLEIGQKLQILKEYIDNKQSNQMKAMNKGKKISQFSKQKQSDKDEDEDEDYKPMIMDSSDDLSPQKKYEEPYYSSQSSFILWGKLVKNLDSNLLKKNLAALQYQLTAQTQQQNDINSQ